MTEEFSLDELMTFLNEGETLPDGFLSTEEWVRKLNTSDYRVRKVLRTAMAKGCLEVRYREVMNLAGRLYWQPTYRFVMTDEI